MKMEDSNVDHVPRTLNEEMECNKNSPQNCIAPLVLRIKAMKRK
jgi:hypothetical protein